MRTLIIASALALAAVGTSTAPAHRAGAEPPRPLRHARQFPAAAQEVKTVKERDLSEPLRGMLPKAPNAQVQTDLETGEIRRVRGSITVTGADNPEEAAETFVRRQSALLLRRQTLLGDVAAERKVESLTGTHVIVTRRYNGLPVFDNEVAVTLNKEVDNVVTLLNNEMESITSAAAPPAAPPDPEQALAAALRSLRAENGVEDTDAQLRHSTPTLGYVVQGGRAILAWDVLVSTRTPLAVWDVMVDPSDNRILSKRNIAAYFAEGRGWIFMPNPVQSTGLFTLTDKMGGALGDADSPVLTGSRVEVALRELDGTGRLNGRFASTAPSASSMNLALEPTLNFNYTRGQANFEEVMAYYWITEAQDYRRLLLGSSTINNVQIGADVHATAENQSQYNPFSKNLEFGTGGVDDAEDAEVIIHEMGHAILDDIACGQGNIATDCRSWAEESIDSEARALAEGFSDYWAASFINQQANIAHRDWCVLWGKWGMDPPPLVGGGGPAFRRRLDNSLSLPDPWGGEEHENGQIWSGALWQIRTSIGARNTDRLILESLYRLIGGQRTFGSAANAILDTHRLLSGNTSNFASEHQLIRAVFQGRRIPIRNE